MQTIQRSISPLCILALATLFFLSCDSEFKPDNNYEKFTGNYNIISYRSNIPVDLNNDGETSTELVKEIYSFDLPYLEIRPHEYQDNKVKLISFSFPKQDFSFPLPGIKGDHIYFTSSGFGTLYVFEFNKYKLEQDSYSETHFLDNAYVEMPVELSSDLRVVDDNHMRVFITKKYYDFDTYEWVLLDIEVLYERQQ